MMIWWWTCPMECSIKSKVVYSTALCQINVVDCAAHSCGVVQPLQRAVPLTQENVVYIHSDHWVIAIYVIESHLTKNDPEQTIQSNMTTEIFAHVGQSQLTSYQIYKKGAFNSSWNSPQNYEMSLVNGIKQCYLPPDRGDRPAFTPTGQVATRFIDPVRMKGWVGLVGRLHTEMVYPSTDGHPSWY